MQSGIDGCVPQELGNLRYALRFFRKTRQNSMPQWTVPESRPHELDRWVYWQRLESGARYCCTEGRDADVDHWKRIAQGGEYHGRLDRPQSQFRAVPDPGHEAGSAE